MLLRDSPYLCFKAIKIELTSEAITLDARARSAFQSATGIVGRLDKGYVNRDSLMTMHTINKVIQIPIVRSRLITFYFLVVDVHAKIKIRC